MAPPQGPPDASRRWPVRAERLDLDLFDLAGDRAEPAIDHLDLLRTCLAAEPEAQMRAGTADVEAGHIGRQLLQWCIAQLPYFALPRYNEFRDDLPRSPVGRILTCELSEEGVTPDTWDAETAGIEYERR